MPTLSFGPTCTRWAYFAFHARTFAPRSHPSFHRNHRSFLTFTQGFLAQHTQPKMMPRKRQKVVPTIHSTSNSRDTSRLGSTANEGPEMGEGDTYKGVQHKDVGIELFVHMHNGFQAILKHRYSDFIVHEIDTNDQVLELKSLQFDMEGAQNVDKVEDDKPEDPFAVLGQQQAPETVEAVRKYLEAGETKDYLIMAPDADKDRRTHLHNVIKEHFPTLTSDVVKDKTGATCIRLAYRSQRGRGDKVDNREKLGGRYCEFVLYKESKETSAAISIIGSKLNVPWKRFTFAGTKDRRAITTQRVQVEGVGAKRLFALNEKELWGMRVNHFKYTDTRLNLGDLHGNRFTVVLRNVENATEEEVDAIMQNLKEGGFINYYGMQRFGTTSIPTHHIGVAIMKSEFKRAVDLILQPREGEQDDITAARKHLQQNPTDLKGTLHKLPNRCLVEKQVIQAMFRTKNPVDILEALPRNSRLMYIHAYQSYVWNKMASERIRKYGLKPIVGDLVIQDERYMLDLERFDSGDEREEEEGKAKEGSADLERQAAKHQDDEKEIPVRILDQADIDSGRFSIYDIVLPMPGYAVMYPSNDLADSYRALMAADGLDIDNLRHEKSQYSLSGAYRKVIIRPANMTWKQFHYSNNEQTLVQSDLEKAKGNPPPTLPEDGEYRALVMNFTLPPSSYATMMIREAMRRETSSEYHKLKTEELRHKVRSKETAE
eukprot:comp23025_c0_seq1/m.36779 comp23025_c0_seq1/g.36779  ORF comp23025_c0_seq1/g.36779 comp23025_c0_seq1/m.36779 type:complete len:714 (-) comp23025_c0_seq1:696-2837(-)